MDHTSWGRGRSDGADLLLELLGDRFGVLGIADHTRGEQHQKLGAAVVVIGRTEERTQIWDLRQIGYAVAAVAVGVLDQAAQCDGLAIMHRYGAGEFPVLDRRRVVTAAACS